MDKSSCNPDFAEINFDSPEWGVDGVAPLESSELDYAPLTELVEESEKALSEFTQQPRSIPVTMDSTEDHSVDRAGVNAPVRGLTVRTREERRPRSDARGENGVGLDQRESGGHRRAQRSETRDTAIRQTATEHPTVVAENGRSRVVVGTRPRPRGASSPRSSAVRKRQADIEKEEELIRRSPLTEQQVPKRFRLPPALTRPLSPDVAGLDKVCEAPGEIRKLEEWWMETGAVAASSPRREPSRVLANIMTPIEDQTSGSVEIAAMPLKDLCRPFGTPAVTRMNWTLVTSGHAEKNYIVMARVGRMTFADIAIVSPSLSINIIPSTEMRKIDKQRTTPPMHLWQVPSLGIIPIAGPQKLKVVIASVEEYIWCFESERTEVPLLGRSVVLRCGLHLSSTFGGLYNKQGERICTRICPRR